MVRVLHVNPFCRKACLEHPKLWSFSSIFRPGPTLEVRRYRDTGPIFQELIYFIYDSIWKIWSWKNEIVQVVFLQLALCSCICCKNVWSSYLHENEICCIFSWIRVLAFHVSWKRKRQLFDDDLTVNSRHKKNIAQDIHRLKQSQKKSQNVGYSLW